MSEHVAGGSAGREVVAIELSAPPTEVWSALRDLDTVHNWFGWDYDGLDAEIQQIFVEEAVEGADGDTRTLSSPGGDVLSVIPAGAGTRLVVTRTAPGTSEATGPDEIDEGWLQFMQQLRFLLEVRPEGRRRTVSALGLDGGPVGAGPVYRLGVAASEGLPVGGAWEVVRALGSQNERVGGTIWYRSHFQAGYTVDDPAGQGLLVVQRVPVAKRPPHGGINLFLSTFGLDDATFAQVQDRWTTWWSGT